MPQKFLCFRTVHMHYNSNLFQVSWPTQLYEIIRASTDSNIPNHITLNKTHKKTIKNKLPLFFLQPKSMSYIGICCFCPLSGVWLNINTIKENPVSGPNFATNMVFTINDQEKVSEEMDKKPSITIHALYRHLVAIWCDCYSFAWRHSVIFALNFK